MVLAQPSRVEDEKSLSPDSYVRVTEAAPKILEGLMTALEIRAADPQQRAIAAGFLRNAIWDTLHAKPARTPLNDVDVIYSDLGDHGAAAEAQIESVLRARCPTVTWEALGIKPGCIFATGMLPIGIRRTPLRTGSKRRPASAFESGAIEGSRSWRPTGSRRTGR